ncbi:hypothetical protein [Photobacterium sanguinicancri]|uniref:hypothetical protein n=1 Tax=Photobacterium sanguinicancri TaxID=875932 RepID=UPI0007879D3C|nr:hypothetical protein [Photobacterium sanguinicancri]KXI21080.1 hypothetical protein AS132_20605 [Photobacterium sanguinicancri]
MATKGSREYEKIQTQKKLVAAIDRLSAGTPKQKKKLRTLKVNKSNVCIEAGLSNGATKHHLRVEVFIEVKQKFPDAIWTDEGEFEKPSSGDTEETSTIQIEEILAAKGNSTSKSGDTSEKLEKQKTLTSQYREQNEKLNAAMKKQLALHEPWVAALMDKLPMDVKKALIEKYKTQLHNGDYENIVDFKPRKLESV